MKQPEDEIFNDFIMFTDLDFGEEITNILPSNLKYETKLEKLELISKMKREKMNEVLEKLPQKNETFHIISNGSFDYFNFIPRIIELTGKIEELYFTTWTMNLKNVKELFQLFDNNSITAITAITGEYLKNREPIVYNTLFDGLKDRQQRIRAINNHAKIILISNKNDYYTIEGSANLTANPRIEQHVISNNKGLMEFHKNWIDKIFDK